MFLNRIKKWFKKYERLLFTYKDGFYVFHYLNNTPQLIINSLATMPFNNHIEGKNLITTNNPFMKGELRYKEIEAGLWLLATKIDYKANVNTVSIYDEKVSDYYFLTFSLYETNNNCQIRINNDTIPSSSWAFYGQNVPIEAFHNKGTKGIFFNFAFDSNWLKNNLIGQSNSISEYLLSLFSSEKGYLFWPGVLDESTKLAQILWNRMTEEDGKKLNNLEFKMHTMTILFHFFERILLKNNTGLDEKIVKNTSIPIQIVNDYLQSNLFDKFPGIEFLSQMANVSSSKLKKDFKKHHGITIYQYFNQQQMLKAMQLIMDGEKQIKNIALMLGYESHSKFSKSFYKYHSILPSEVLKKNN